MGIDRNGATATAYMNILDKMHVETCKVLSMKKRESKIETLTEVSRTRWSKDALLSGLNTSS